MAWHKTIIAGMWHRFWKPLLILLPSAAIVLAVLYVTYRWIDPLPPRHFAIAAGAAGSGYDNFARQYARILAREGVDLEPKEEKPVDPVAPIETPIYKDPGR